MSLLVACVAAAQRSGPTLGRPSGATAAVMLTVSAPKSSLVHQCPPHRSAALIHVKERRCEQGVRRFGRRDAAFVHAILAMPLRPHRPPRPLCHAAGAAHASIDSSSVARHLPMAVMKLDCGFDRSRERGQSRAAAIRSRFAEWSSAMQVLRTNWPCAPRPRVGPRPRTNPRSPAQRRQARLPPTCAGPPRPRMQAAAAALASERSSASLGDSIRSDPDRRGSVIRGGTVLQQAHRSVLGILLPNLLEIGKILGGHAQLLPGQAFANVVVRREGTGPLSRHNVRRAVRP
jgi:hypothetical protein